MKREENDILINLKADDTIEFEMPEDESIITTPLQSAVIYFIADIVNNDPETMMYIDKLFERKEFEYSSEVMH